jgi:hypothetical protein
MEKAKKEEETKKKDEDAKKKQEENKKKEGTKEGEKTNTLVEEQRTTIVVNLPDVPVSKKEKAKAIIA